jgi:hypothetical protein
MLLVLLSLSLEPVFQLRIGALKQTIADSLNGLFRGSTLHLMFLHEL